MKSLELLQQLEQTLQLDQHPERTDAVVQAVGQLMHDINNPIGTVGLELYNLQKTVQRLQAELAADERQSLTQLIERLADIATNLQQAQEQALELVGQVRRQKQDWAERLGSPPRD